MPATKRSPVKPKQVTGINQGTEEWKLLRCGKVTASRIPDVMNFLKNGKEGGDRAKYKIQIVTEMLTGVPYEYALDTAAMRWGREQEPFARFAYAKYRGCTVDQIAFAYHPTIELAGASPDGLVGKNGLVEIKCPMSSTHVQYVLADVVPDDYRYQIIWQLACMPEREWVDFISFDPRTKDNLRLFIKRLHRDKQVEEEIKTITAGVELFLGECRSLVTQLENWKLAL